MICSMTAFARGEQPSPGGTLVCEMRSVNHRYLEISVRLPDVVRELELPLRELMRGRLGRGKVDCTIRLSEDPDQARGQALSAEAAARLKAMVVELTRLFEDGADGARTGALQLNAVDLLRWPGILQTEEINQDTIGERTKALVEATLAELVATRSREGEELRSLIHERLADIERAVGSVRQALPQLLENHRTQLRAKLAQLAQEVDEARFEQELVYLLQKSDVAEELDRLATHVDEVKRVLHEGGVVGRRLDFLMQELNREANTLSSKSISAETSLHAVDLKVLIEQMREQIQNIE